MTEPDINTLYEAARSGSRASEEELFTALSARFRYFVRRRVWDSEDAKDIVQNALMTISREYKETAIVISFAAWAYRVLDYRILQYIQTRKRETQRIEQSMEPGDLSVSDADCHEPELKQELLNCLQKIGKENIRYARTLNLKYQGFETEEICRKLNLTASNFYSILSRARSMLETCLEKGKIN